MNAKPLLIIILLFSIQSTVGEPPRIFQEKDFSAAIVAEAVNHFVQAGENASVRELEALAVDRPIHDRKNGFSINERIGWMCRVLFIAKPGEHLRPPRFGGLSLPYLTMPFDRWPLFPVAHSGSTYFVLDEGYKVVGLPENTKAYIQYCRENGVFRKERVPVPTRAQAIKDAASLRESDRWKMIKWSENTPGRSFTMDESVVFRFIQKQAETIKAE